MSHDDKWDKWDKRIRDVVLFIVGIGGIINELWFVTEPRPWALGFLASVVGVPFILEAQLRQRRKGDPDE